jgi:hypothetical protein
VGLIVLQNFHHSHEIPLLSFPLLVFNPLWVLSQKAGNIRKFSDKNVPRSKGFTGSRF